jgi:hypothetical protein
MTECDTVELTLGDFHWENSRTAQCLRELFPFGRLTRRPLYSFATLPGALADITLNRDFTRRRELLMKWFDHNFDALEPYLGFLEFDLNP